MNAISQGEPAARRAARPDRLEGVTTGHGLALAAVAVGQPALDLLQRHRSGTVAHVYDHSVYLSIADRGLVALLPANRDNGPLHMRLRDFEPLGRALERRAVATGTRWRLLGNEIEGEQFCVDLAGAAPWIAPGIRRLKQAPNPELPAVIRSFGERSDPLDALLGRDPSVFWPNRLNAALRAIGLWLHERTTTSCTQHDDNAADKVLAPAVQTLIGAGRGLTPAGDDVLAGIALAMRAVAPARCVQFGSVVDDHLRATHPVSAALLREALKGRASATSHAVLDALINGPPEHALLTRLSPAGASSGFDMLAGMLLVTHKAIPEC